MLAPALGMGVPAPLLAGNLRKPGFLRPEPRFEKYVSRFLPRHEGVWVSIMCFYPCETPAQIVKIQSSCLWVQRRVLSNEFRDSYRSVCVMSLEQPGLARDPVELDGPHRRIF